MSLRIKLPGKTSDTPSPSQLSDSAMPLRRKSVKRRMRVESEDEEDEGQLSSRSNEGSDTPKRPFNHGRSNKSMQEHQVMLDFDTEVPDGVDQKQHPEQHESGSKPTKSKSRSEVDAPPPKKKARVVESEPESEEEYVDDEELNEPILDGDDEEFILEDERPVRHKGKRKSGKEATSKNHGTRRKGKAVTTEGKVKSERRRSVTTTGDTSQSEIGVKRPRPKSSLKIEETVVDVVGDSVERLEPSALSDTGSPSHPKETSPVPPAAKKRKLPTIKKNKLATSAGSNTPSSKPNLALATKLPIPEPNKSLGMRKPAATAGNADLDLTDMNVYAELFKNAPGVPRTASNRRTKDEERRKELDRMREEARAKRAEEASHSFDLQAQLDKIARFEERLRVERSPALYPNHLAGKWRGQWEQDRRKRRERGYHEDSRSNGREEGETSENPSIVAR